MNVTRVSSHFALREYQSCPPPPSSFSFLLLLLLLLSVPLLLPHLLLLLHHRKVKPPLTNSFNILSSPLIDKSMLEVCADFIADAKAGPNAMRPKELCSACEMCDDPGRDMKLYQETQRPAGCHLLSSPSSACTRLSLLACLPTATKHRDSGLLIGNKRQ